MHATRNNTERELAIIISFDEEILGKPYARELDALVETYLWALHVPISEIEMAVQELFGYPLVAVGSGGSLAAAAFASSVHEVYTGQLSRAASPLDAANIYSLRQSGVLLLSAGGKNVDVRGAFSSILRSEPAAMSVLCFSPGSPLSRLAKQNPPVRLFESKLPHGKDGFLSVNSLLAFSLLLLRAYAGETASLPSSLSQLISADNELESCLDQLRQETAGLWNKRFIVLVHGADVKPAAVDMESKFSEAALVALQLADLRNFAHGRHHWLAKHPNDTAVIFLVSESDLRSATRTQRIIPTDIASAIISVPGEGPLAALRALFSVFHLTKFAGEAKNIDPGRPGVPKFGSRIYSLNIWSAPRDPNPEERKRVAVDRKIAACGTLVSHRTRTRWEESYDSFVESITENPFRGLVCDYDGTLIDHRDRTTGIGKPIAAHLNRILEAGCLVGIATGRGSSVREDLLQVIAPAFHSSIYVGYHNCAEIALLSTDPVMFEERRSSRVLAAAGVLLTQSAIIGSMCTMHISPSQIGLRANDGIDVPTLYRAVLDAIASLLQKGVQCLISTHSVDVIASTQSKGSLLKHLEELSSGDFLTVGDLGQWPGNDFALLQRPFSLSSRQVSSAPDSCWNLAPAGVLNVSATLFYLNSIELTRDGFVLSKSHLLRF